MGIESLLKFSPSPQFRQSIIDIQKAETTKSSLINILARRFIRAGTEGLRQISNQVADSSVISTGGLEYRKEKILQNMGAILLGTAVITIEEALVEKSIDYNSLWARYNEALVGTIVTPHQISGDGVRPLSFEEWWQVIEIAKEDQTLSNFFIKQNPIRDYLSNKLIVDQPALQFICATILPQYRELA